jgi:hypothetical protein
LRYAQIAPLILIDTNVFMYVAGRAHPHKAASAALIVRVAQGKIEAAIDAEVLQEILHRYRGEWLAQGRALYDHVRRTVPTVLPITAEVIDSARFLMDAHEGLAARDAVHAAVCLQSGLEAICSYDSVFARIGLASIRPEALS